MDKNLALVVALVIGGVVALQGPLNSMLARSTGGLPATTIALGVSFLSLAILTTLAGQLNGFSDVGNAPTYAVIGGGLVGALYVGSIVWTVRALGVTGLSAATLAGQFAAALVIDHCAPGSRPAGDPGSRTRGYGVERSSITAAKLAGVALLAAGTYLIVSD